MESLGVGLKNQQLEPFLITLEPGVGSDGKEAVTHPGQEFIYCIKGEVEYRVEENTYKLKPGDSLMLEATRTHYVRNPGSKPVTFLIVFQSVGSSNIGSQVHF